MPSGVRDGRTINRSGQVVAHASLSARQAKEMGLLTSGTYGHISTTSSNSADLALSLVNRLRAKTVSTGSTLYKLIWKERVTPQQRSISALRASARRISGSGSIGWPTPTANDYKGSGPTVIRQDGRNRMFDRLDYATEQGIAGEMLTGSRVGMESKGRLNPAHSRWLMGLPIEWDASAPMEMPLLRQSRKNL